MRRAYTYRLSCAFVAAFFFVGLSVAGAQTCVSEGFDSYPDGPLVGNGDWTGNAATSNEIEVKNGAVLIKATGSQDIYSADLPVNCEPCEGGVIRVSFKVKAGSGGGTLWYVRFNDPNGVNLASFYGPCISVAGRTGMLGLGYLTGVQVLTGGETFDTCEAEINTVTHQTTYYINGVLMPVDPPNRLNPVSHGIDGGANQTPQNRVGLIHFERQATTTSTGSVTIDDVQITLCAGTCSAQVSPTAAQVSYAPEGQAASPASFDFTILNNNQDELSYTAEEADASGAAHEWPWLSLNKAGGGPLTNSQPADTVTATIDTTGLTAGVYVGYVKFTSTCPSPTSYLRAVKLLVGNSLSDEFSYPDGNLDRAPGWAGPPVGVTNPVQIANGAAQITGGMFNSAVSLLVSHDLPAAMPACPGPPPEAIGGMGDRIIVVKAKVKGNPAGGVNNMWAIHFTDENGKDLARWYGAESNVKGRNGQLSTETKTLTGNWQALEAWIDIDAMLTTYYLDGQLLGAENPIAHEAGSGLSVIRVSVERTNRTEPETAGNVVRLDDIQVDTCKTNRQLLCHAPIADIDGDGDVDQADFAVLQACYTGPSSDGIPIPSIPEYCACLDTRAESTAPGADGDIDAFDLTAFEDCATGPGIPADANCL